MHVKLYFRSETNDEHFKSWRYSIDKQNDIERFSSLQSTKYEAANNEQLTKNHCI